MTQIYLVRHAATRVPEYEQQDNEPISPLGQLQAVKVANRIKNHAQFVHKIYTSTLTRAIQTAEIIGDIIEATIEESTHLDEVEQMARINTDEEYQQLARSIIEQATIKAIAFLRDIGHKHHDETIVAVTHGNIIKAIVAKACEKSIEEVVTMAIGNSSLTILSYDHNANTFTLVLLNDTMHLQ